MNDEELSAEEAVELSNRMFRCKSQRELARVLDFGQIEETLKGLPDSPSEVLALCTLHLERIRRKLDRLPDEDPSFGDIEKAAAVLGSEYLLRLEFLADYAVHPEGIAWTLNPLHNSFETIERLKGKDEFLHRLARMILARDAGLAGQNLRFRNS